MKLHLELHDALLEKVARGWSLQKVADWLRRRHGIQVTKQAVAKVVRKHRTERADVAKVVARRHIEKTLPKDLQAFDDIQATNLRLLRAAQREAERTPTVAVIEKVCKLTAVYQRAQEAKQRAVGLEQPDQMFDGLGEVLLALRRAKLD